MKHYDAIVVGLGAMGSATLCHLALRGARVLGLEQFAQGHTLGSSHGDSRIIRETYFEHPLYVPLVQRAHELWRDLEERSGARLMTITGGLMIGPRDGMVVTGTLRSVAEHNLPHEVMTAEEIRARFPEFRIKQDLTAVFDPRAGILDPEACNRAHIDVARTAGAEVRFNERATDWIADGDGVRVSTVNGTYTADRLALTAGPWTSEALKGLDLPLIVERQTLFWFDAAESTSYDSSRFPIYAYEFKPGTICYGFPRLSRGVKASVMHDGVLSNHPSQIDREIHASEVDPLRAALRPILPELAEAAVRDSAVCLFTNTPDHDFIIDFHPGFPQVLISSPCSGHGFKFASAIGEIQADLLTTGNSKFDLSPFKIGRFAQQ
ncbi:MAG: N-methyl-L-tryptophan oxidase [Gemmatimonadaceae bacterium]